MSEQELKSGRVRKTIIGVRWFARLVAAFLGVFLVLFIVGEGPPPLWVLVPWLVVLAGFVLGWKYEGLGAVLVLGAFVYFNLHEYWWSGRFLRLEAWAFYLLLLPGLAFLFCWVIERWQAAKRMTRSAR